MLRAWYRAASPRLPLPGGFLIAMGFSEWLGNAQWWGPLLILPGLVLLVPLILAFRQGWRAERCTRKEEKEFWRLISAEYDNEPRKDRNG